VRLPRKPHGNHLPRRCRVKRFHFSAVLTGATRAELQRRAARVPSGPVGRRFAQTLTRRPLARDSRL
jgi:hypothetical protein